MQVFCPPKNDDSIQSILKQTMPWYSVEEEPGTKSNELTETKERLPEHYGSGTQVRTNKEQASLVALTLD